MRKLDQPKDLAYEIVEKAVVDGARYGFRYSGLTGGEPLLYPRFGDLTELLVKNNYRFKIETNGYMLEDFSALLVRHRDHILCVQFSLDDSDERHHDHQRRGGSFGHLVKAFRFCRDNKIPFTINTVISSVNADRLFDIALYAKKKGASMLSVSAALPCPRTRENSLVLDKEKRDELYAAAREIPRILNFPIVTSLTIRSPEYKIKFCPTLTPDNITVNIDGNVVLCCLLGYYDDEQIRNCSVVASLRDKTFPEALEAYSERIHQFTRERIRDLQGQADPGDIDFNSCFYCLRKFSNA